MPKVTVRIPFRVSNDEIQFSEKAVQLPIYRKEGGRCVERIWFPLSQVDYSKGAEYTKISIPKWLLDEKVGDNFTIR